jgi:hypothetical protein
MRRKEDLLTCVVKGPADFVLIGVEQATVIVSRKARAIEMQERRLPISEAPKFGYAHYGGSRIFVEIIFACIGFFLYAST